MKGKRLVSGLKVVFVALGLLFSARAATAQNSNGVWRLPPEPSNSQRGTEARPHQAVTGDLLRQPVAFSFVPVVMMSDGSVFANFGFGFEPVARPCSSGLVIGQPTVVGSNGVVLSQPQQPTYTQPVPNQQSPSQFMVSPQQQRMLSVAAQRACFNRDVSGRVFVPRP